MSELRLLTAAAAFVVLAGLVMRLLGSRTSSTHYAVTDLASHDDEPLPHAISANDCGSGTLDLLSSPALSNSAGDRPAASTAAKIRSERRPRPEMRVIGRSPNKVRHTSRRVRPVLRVLTRT